MHSLDWRSFSSWVWSSSILPVFIQFIQREREGERERKEREREKRERKRERERETAIQKVAASTTLFMAFTFYASSPVVDAWSGCGHIQLERLKTIKYPTPKRLNFSLVALEREGGREPEREREREFWGFFVSLMLLLPFGWIILEIRYFAFKWTWCIFLQSFMFSQADGFCCFLLTGWTLFSLFPLLKGTVYHFFNMFKLELYARRNEYLRSLIWLSSRIFNIFFFHLLPSPIPSLISSYFVEP